MQIPIQRLFLFRVWEYLQGFHHRQLGLDVLICEEGRIFTFSHHSQKGGGRGRWVPQTKKGPPHLP
jgi:hypothetical protein